MRLAHDLALSAREVAFGLPYGEDPDAESLPRVDAELAPLAALGDAIRPALRRAPCVVPFSGGRDSSAVLAVATALARREGLAPPVPVTLRFPRAPGTEESVWQERVIAHLGLADWERIERHDELDFVGPVATRCLLTHGLLWPPNAHLLQALLQRAGAGSLLTGLDGDGVFGEWPWPRVAAVLSGRARPEPRDLLRVGHAAAPGIARGWIARRRDQGGPLPRWLRPCVHDAYLGVMREARREPVRWSARIATLARQRYLSVACAALGALARDTGTLLLHPFLDRRFLAALARAGGSWGWGDRTATMTALFSELLPAETVARPTKALFDEIFWGEQSRSFARGWDGTGVDQTLVDPHGLRTEWLESTPHAGSATLLQAAWLHASRRAAPVSSRR